MAIEIMMPKLSDTMEEGKIIKWLVSEGDAVASGDVIAEIETDKADMEFEVIEDGFIKQILVGEGETIPVGKLIAVMTEDEDEEVESSASEDTDETAEEAVEDVAVEEEVTPVVPEEPEIIEEAPVVDSSVEKSTTANAAASGSKASPVARKLAAEAGLDILQIPGSGPDGPRPNRRSQAGSGPVP